MGTAVYISLEEKIPDLDHIGKINGKQIAKHWEELNEAARIQNLKPLEAFVSMDEEAVSNLIGENSLGESKVKLPPETWFPATDGLRVVRFLKEKLGVNPDYADLLKDLNDYEQVLSTANAHQTWFHLEFDF